MQKKNYLKIYDNRQKKNSKLLLNIEEELLLLLDTTYHYLKNIVELLKMKLNIIMALREKCRELRDCNKMKRAKLIISITLAVTILSSIGGYFWYNRVDVQASKQSIGLSITQGIHEAEDIKAPPVYGKAYVHLEESGCKIQDGNIRLRFDYYLDPSAVGYEKHHVYVIDETSKEFLAGYQGKVDERRNPLDQKDYDNWVNSLPHIWHNNPFVCVFVYVPPTLTDKEIQDKATAILNEAYRHWAVGLDMRGFRTAESAMTVKELTPTEKTTYDTKLTNLVNRKEVFDLAP